MRDGQFNLRNAFNMKLENDTSLFLVELPYS